MKQSGFGIASLILGILGFLGSCFVFGIVPGVLGIVLAIIGLCQKDRAKGTAIAGLVLSIIGTAIAGFSILFGIALFETDESDTAKKHRKQAFLKVQAQKNLQVMFLMLEML